MLAIGLLPIVLIACSSGESSPKTSASSSSPDTEKPVSGKPAERWYAFEHVSQGGRVFQENCASCHGKRGEGAADWWKVGANGKYPAPPLNGTGHAWHHPLKMLFHVIKNGSPGGQGNMLAWGEKLSDEEMIAVIAWFQSKWSDQIYAAWIQREMASRSVKKG